jgi:hypothetical protein
VNTTGGPPESCARAAARSRQIASTTDSLLE